MTIETENVSLDQLLALADELKRLTRIIDEAIIPINRAQNLIEKYELQKQLQNMSFDFLAMKDDDFGKKIKENRGLLIQNDILCKAYKTSVGYAGAHARIFEGHLHENGYLYLETQQTNSRLNPFSGILTPVLYTGYFSPLGNVTATLKKTSVFLLGSKIPREFMAGIDAEGNFEMKTSIAEFEWWGSEQYVSRIVADPFNGDADKTEAFLENKEVLVNTYQDFCKTILKL